jgi:hypothetical protein
MLCGSNALFIVDRIESDEPVRATWHWLLNNRDGQLDLQLMRPNHILARRRAAGMKLIHCGSGQMSGPVYAHVHDAYHPLPAQLGEGHPGSGQLMRWSESTPATARTVVHAIALDAPSVVESWQVSRNDAAVILHNDSLCQRWSLLPASNGNSLTLSDAAACKNYTASIRPDGTWGLVVC